MLHEEPMNLPMYMSYRRILKALQDEIRAPVKTVNDENLLREVINLKYDILNLLRAYDRAQGYLP